jgi:Flp pilus assembly protein TadB
VAVDQREFETFRVQRARLWYVVALALAGLCIGVCFGIAALWSLAAGLVVAMALAAMGFELLLRWNRERWKRRFHRAAFPVDRGATALRFAICGAGNEAYSLPWVSCRS